MNTEQYIEHEVELRVHSRQIKQIESKLNTLIALVISGWFLPIALKALGLV